MENNFQYNLLLTIGMVDGLEQLYKDQLKDGLPLAQQMSIEGYLHMAEGCLENLNGYLKEH